MSEADQNGIDRALLARAAGLAGIPLTAIGADDTPWNTSLSASQAALWAAAVAEIDPGAAEAMQKLHCPISMALAMALEGELDFTPELMSELQSKRPDTYRLRKQAAIDEAVAAMEIEMARNQAARVAAAQSLAASSAELRAHSAEQTRQVLRSQACASHGAW
jgi:hypothetical protein